jgi:hypothetical protein
VGTARTPVSGAIVPTCGLYSIAASYDYVDGPDRYVIRFQRQANIVDGRSVEKAADPGIWELMWFGHAR